MNNNFLKKNNDKTISNESDSTDEKMVSDDIYKDYVKDDEPTENSDSFIENNTDNVNNHETYHEKEYNSGYLNSHTKVSSNRSNKLLLVGFYIIVLIVGVVVFFMILTDKYEFYFKNDSIVINKGSTYQVEITPKNIKSFDYLNYKYSIDDESIATVDEFGTIKAKGVGTTYLKVSMKYGLISKKMKITSDNVIIDGIIIKVEKKEGMLPVKEINMTVKDTITLHAFASNRDDINLSVNYNSSDKNIAIVDEFGNVTAKKVGTAVITASIDNLAESITVKVSNMEDETSIVPKNEIESISFKENNISMKKGASLQLSLVVNPSNLSNSTFNWMSNSDIVSVDNYGHITANKEGKAIITVTSDNGKTATCNVEVITETIKIEKIELSDKSLTLKNGHEYQLFATISPNNATERELIWTSSNPNVVKVEDGLLKAVNGGEATITVKTKESNVSDSCKVKVINSSNSSKLTDVNIGIVQTTKYVGDELQLNAKLTPSTAKVSSISWISSDPKIASVSSDGLVSMKKVGTVIITVNVDGIKSSGTIIVKNKN